MKWQLKQPLAGDMIRVKTGSIYHYGIFVSEDEIIQFGLAPSARPTMKDCDIEVCISDIDQFLCGGFLETAEFDRSERKKNRKPKDVISYARKNLGKRGYNIIYNNCEHFAYDCVTGKPFCSQTEDVRALFKSLPIVDVYVAKIPDHPCMEPLSCKEREQEINETSNPKVKLEKHYVWKLLEYALERSFGLQAKKLKFSKSDEGKWTTEKCCFSLSHSNNVVAVAISRTSVGVDIESLHSISKEQLANRILTEEECVEYEKTDPKEREHFLLKAWTAKESLLKKEGAKTFIPRNYNSLIKTVRTQDVLIEDQPFALSVATDTPEVLRTYVDITLS